jgi:hypothetical protein
LAFSLFIVSELDNRLSWIPMETTLPRPSRPNSRMALRQQRAPTQGSHPLEQGLPGLMQPAKRFKLDTHLESAARDMIVESHPVAILQTTLSDTPITMLLATHGLWDKRAGLVNLTGNPDLYPKSSNIQVKLDFPKELKDDEKTLENVIESRIPTLRKIKNHDSKSPNWGENLFHVIFTPTSDKRLETCTARIGLRPRTCWRQIVNTTTQQTVLIFCKVVVALC